MGSKSGSGSATGRGSGRSSSSPAATIKTATELLVDRIQSDFGVTVELLPTDSPEIAQAIHDAFSDLKERGYGDALVKSIGRSNDFDALEIAHAEIGRGRIVINVANSEWTDRIGQRHAEETGWASDGSLKGVIVHEMGHILHGKEVERRLIADNPKKYPRKRIGATYVQGGQPGVDADYKIMAMRGQTGRSGVSKYATTNQLEFVAETFAGLVAGKKYSSDVMAEYQRLFGPAARRSSGGN